MQAQEDLEAIVDRIVENHSVDEAISKLNGYFRQFHWNDHLRISMGKLYLQQADFVRAGKMFYLRHMPNEAEKRAIKRFEESCKHKALRIFEALVEKAGRRSPSGIDPRTSGKLFSLILRIAEEENGLPIHVVRWIVQYERIRSIEIERGSKQTLSS